MAKNSYKQIIEDEKKIIEQLLQNANKSINEIAKSCGFSRQKVWRIIKNLEKSNIIWGYTAVIDEAKQSRGCYQVLIKRTNQPISKKVLDTIISRELVKSSEKMGIRMNSSVYTNGIYDWVITFVARDVKEAKRFVERLNILFEGYVSEIQLLEAMFSVQKGGIENPEKEKLRNLFNDAK
jgi:DNA-binding Lrp family transcriptional regulator